METKLHRHGGQNKINKILNFVLFNDNYNRTIIDDCNFRFSTSCNSEKVETVNTLRISCEPQLQTLSTTTYICSVILIYEGSKIFQENGLNIALKFVMGRWIWYFFAIFTTLFQNFGKQIVSSNIWMFIHHPSKFFSYS